VAGGKYWSRQRGGSIRHSSLPSVELLSVASEKYQFVDGTSDRRV